MEGGGCRQKKKKKAPRVCLMLPQVSGFRCFPSAPSYPSHSLEKKKSVNFHNPNPQTIDKKKYTSWATCADGSQIHLTRERANNKCPKFFPISFFLEKKSLFIFMYI